jgi:hypothetical protein
MNKYFYLVLTGTSKLDSDEYLKDLLEKFGDDLELLKEGSNEYYIDTTRLKDAKEVLGQVWDILMKHYPEFAERPDDSNIGIMRANNTDYIESEDRDFWVPTDVFPIKKAKKKPS